MSNKEKINIIISISILLIYLVVQIRITYSVFTPKGDATLYSAIMYDIIEGRVPSEMYYLAPFLILASISKVTGIKPHLLLIISDFVVRFILNVVLLYLLMKIVKPKNIIASILFTMTVIATISLSAFPPFVEELLGEQAYWMFAWYKILTDFNSPETFKLASIALYLFIILLLIRWSSPKKIIGIMSIITLIYPALGLLTLITYALSISTNYKISYKEKIKINIIIAIIISIMSISIYMIQIYYSHGMFITSYTNVNPLMASIIGLLLVPLSIFAAKTKIYRVIYKYFENIIYSRFIKLIYIIQLILIVIGIFYIKTQQNVSFHSSYFIDIRYVIMYLFSIMPLIMTSLMKYNTESYVTGQYPVFCSNKVNFIIIMTHFLLVYYLFTVIYPPLIYVLKGYIVMNILFLMNVLFLIINIYQKNRIAKLDILLVISFIFSSLYGYLYHISIWGRIDVANLIGITESIFDPSHSAIEHFKAYLNHNVSIFVSEDYYSYHLFLLHGIPNLLHPETLSAKDLVGVNYTIIYTFNISNKIYHIYDISPLIHQWIQNYPTNSVSFIIKGRVFNHSNSAYVVSNVTYGAVIIGSNLIRISNYPVIECTESCKIYKLNNNIYLVIGNELHISNNLQLYRYDTPYNTIVVLLLLTIIFTTLANLRLIVKRNNE